MNPKEQGTNNRELIPCAKLHPTWRYILEFTSHQYMHSELILKLAQDCLRRVLLSV